MVAEVLRKQCVENTSKMAKNLYLRASNDGASCGSFYGLCHGAGKGIPPVCLVCGEKGHLTFLHAQKSLTKPIWAPLCDKVLVHPVSKTEIYTNFNILGPTKKCTHGSERLNVCCWCGSKDHYAFSHACCPRN